MKKLILMLSVIFALAVYFMLFIKVDVSRYSGDGKIFAKGQGAISKGFVVEFPEFSLNNDYSAIYSLKNLPNLNKMYVFNINVFAPYKNATKPNFDARVKLVIKNNVNQVLYEKDSLLSEWELQNFTDFPYYIFSDYNIDGNAKIYDNGEYLSDDAKIEFSFIPEKNDFEVDTKVKLSLKSGGFK